MKPTPRTSKSLHAVLACSAGLIPFAHAVTWDGSDSSDWSDGLNWVGDTAPIAADTLEFSGTAIANQPTNNDVAAATSFGVISFPNDGTVGVSDAAFTLDGNSITLGGNISTTATTTGTLEDIIALDIEYGAIRNINTQAGHNIRITGNITDNGAGVQLRLGDNNSTNNEGDVIISGDNTSTGGTRISRHAHLRVESNTAVGASLQMIRASTLILAPGVDLAASNGISTTTGAGNQVITLDEAGTTAASISAGIFANNGNGSSGLVLTVGEDDTLTLNGVISGTDKYTKNGAGSLIVTNVANTHSGDAIVNAGTMTLGASAVLGGGASSLNMNGGSLDLGATTQTIGTMVVSGAAVSGDSLHNGSINATAYNFTIGAGNATVSAALAGTGNISKTGNGTVTLSGTNTFTGTVTSSAGAIVATSAAAFPGYTTPANVVFDGGTIGVQVAGAGWTPAELSDLLTNATKTSGGLGIDTTNGDFTPAAAFSPATLGPLGLTKLGTNSLTLDQSNSYTGDTTLSEGTLNLDNVDALGATVGSVLFIANGTTIDNTSGGAITLANDPSVSLPGDGFVFGGTNDLNLGSGAVTLNLPPNNTTRVITLNGAGSTLTLGDSTSPARGGNTNFQVDGVGNTLVFNSLGLNQSGANRTNTWSGTGNVTVIGGVLDAGIDGGQRFTYSGTGTFTIGGASDYIGNTTVSSGTLALGAGGSLSDGTNVVMNGTGVIDLAAGVSDAIKSLTIIGVNGDAALPDGTYGNTASGADNGGLGVGALDAYLTGSGVFTITTATAFETWAGGELFEDDTNGDGVDNGLAWILGAADPNADALSLLPVPVESSGELSMSFPVVDPIAPAQLFIEYSTDLGASAGWTSVEVPAASGTVDDLVFVIGGGTVSVTIPATEALDGKLFSRLNAIEN